MMQYDKNSTAIFGSKDGGGGYEPKNAGRPLEARKWKMFPRTSKKKCSLTNTILAQWAQY